MEQSNFSKIANALKIAYPYYFKDMSKGDSNMFLQLYYNKLKKYQYEVVAIAIDKIITTNNFMPTLAEVIAECDKEYKIYYKNILQEMYKQGYFKTDEEYGKAVMWLLEDKPLIPNWLKKELLEFEKTINRKLSIEGK